MAGDQQNMQAAGSDMLPMPAGMSPEEQQMQMQQQMMSDQGHKVAAEVYRKSMTNLGAMQDVGGNLRPPGQHMTERRTAAAMNDPQMDHNEAKAVDRFWIMEENDENNLMNVQTNLVPKIHEILRKDPMTPSLRDPVDQPMEVNQQPMKTGALESLLQSRPSANVLNRMVFLIAELVKDDPASSCGLRKDMMGRNCEIEDYPDKVISAPTLLNLLNESMHQLDSQGPVVRAGIPHNGRLVIVGDTHGQLADLFWIWFKHGIPDDKTVYVFNGDICDRGGHAVEIFILLLYAKRVFPNSVFINRGNHEDAYCNSNLGFHFELRKKFGEEAPVLIEAFHTFFEYLSIFTVVDGISGIYSAPPLISGEEDPEIALEVREDGSCTVYGQGSSVPIPWVDSLDGHVTPEGDVTLGGAAGKWDRDSFTLTWADGMKWNKVSGQMFVVHGGIPLLKDDMGQLQVVNIEEDVPRADFRRPVPPSANPESDALFFTALWSDPTVESRGKKGRGRPWSEADTRRFCEVNRFHGVVRSHQLPKARRGFEIYHDCLCMTVFSASNYCGTGRNAGGLLMFQPGTFPIFSDETVKEFMAPEFADIYKLQRDFSTAPPTVREIVADSFEEAADVGFVPEPKKVDDAVLHYIQEMIVMKKPMLWDAFQKEDPNYTLTVSVKDWINVLAAVVGRHFPWAELMQILNPEVRRGQIRYARFLKRYQLRFDTHKYGLHLNWVDQLTEHLFRKLLQADLPLQQVISLFDQDNDGKITFEEFQQALTKVDAPIPREQAQMIYSNIMSGTHEEEFIAMKSPAARGSMMMGDVLGKDSNSNAEYFLVEFARIFGASERFPTTPETEWVTKELDRVGRSLHHAHGSLLKAYTAGANPNTGLATRNELKPIVGRALDGIGLDLSVRSLEQRADDVTNYLDVFDNDKINFLGFICAFTSSGAMAAQEMGNSSLEQFTRLLYSNRQGVRSALQYFDRRRRGTVDKGQFKAALNALVGALSASGWGSKADLLNPKLLDTFLECLKFKKDRRFDYEEFLDSFRVVDIYEKAGLKNNLSRSTSQDDTERVVRSASVAGAMLLQNAMGWKPPTGASFGGNSVVNRSGASFMSDASMSFRNTLGGYSNANSNRSMGGSMSGAHGVSRTSFALPVLARGGSLHLHRVKIEATDSSTGAHQRRESNKEGLQPVTEGIRQDQDVDME